MTTCSRLIKRVLDVIAAAVALLLLWPLMLLLVVWIRLDSPGRAVFAQQRAGRGMKPFVMYKFRTMKPEAEPFGVSPADGADPRLTRSGRLLRETSLDELPQLWNVLKGDMSLVGPRPLYMSQAQLFTARQRHRLDVRPGITGLAQVVGRGDLPHAEKLELDVQYVENASLKLDAKILIRTLLQVVRRRKVYQGWAGDGISMPGENKQNEH